MGSARAENARREAQKMNRVKIAICASEPALYTSYEPVFEESPFLIIVDEYGNVQKYSPDIGQKSAARGRIDWIIARGAKILVTGAIGDADYRRLRRAGVAVKWEVFGEVRNLVERARLYSEPLLATLAAERRDRGN